MQRSRTQVIAEAGIVLALAAMLKAVAIVRLPQGGSVTAGSLVPLWLFASRHGLRHGAALGAVFGVLDLMLHPIVVHPMQVVLDYPLAFAGCGFAGAAWMAFPAGCMLSVAARYGAHTLSGALFFAAGAPAGTSPIVFSAIYNLYALADGAFALVLALGIRRRTASGGATRPSGPSPP